MLMAVVTMSVSLTTRVLYFWNYS